MSTPPPLRPQQSVHPAGVVPYQQSVYCPTCGSPNSKSVSFTWWGGVVGPKLLHHVKCLQCRQGYNGRTGQLNTTKIVAWNVVSVGLGVGLMVVFFITRH